MGRGVAEVFGPGIGGWPLVDVVIVVPPGVERVSVLGAADRNAKMIREVLGVRVTLRDEQIRMSGEAHALAAARRVFEALIADARQNAGATYSTRRALLELLGQAMHEASSAPIDHADPDLAMQADDIRRGTGGQARSGRAPHSEDDPGTGPLWGDTLNVYVAGKPIRGRTPNQQVYLDAIRDHDVVFGIGPAGTGKTYLAVAAAVHMLKAGMVRKVVLARPAVEAGEKLGFLPGDLAQKVNPYLRPLFDALNDMMDFSTLKRFMMSDVVEVCPLAYMRGRTLNRSVIILDEAQNTTRGQMKMFLTRMGQGSRLIITGDTTQIDLPDPRESGLIDAARTLRRVPGIAMVTFGESDIVRHHMLQSIVEAYAQSEQAREAARSGRPPRPPLPTRPPHSNDPGPEPDISTPADLSRQPEHS